MASNEPERVLARHELYSGIGRVLGFRPYNVSLAWPNDSEFLAAWSTFPETTGGVKDRHFALWSIARSLRRLEGDTAECGVYNGASSYLICHAIGSRHHAFDSFEGLSSPTDLDSSDDSGARPWAAGELAVGEERVRANLEAFDVVTYRGWIPSRFDEVADRKFRLVHIDVDLYEPTRDSVQFFFPRLVPGGYVVCDDYGFTTCPGAKRAMDEYAESVGLSVVHSPVGPGFLIKPCC